MFECYKLSDIIMVVWFTNTVTAKSTFSFVSQQSKFSKILQKFTLMYSKHK